MLRRPNLLILLLVLVFAVSFFYAISGCGKVATISTSSTSSTSSISTTSVSTSTVSTSTTQAFIFVSAFSSRGTKPYFHAEAITSDQYLFCASSMGQSIYGKKASSSTGYWENSPGLIDERLGRTMYAGSAAAHENTIALIYTYIGQALVTIEARVGTLDNISDPSALSTIESFTPNYGAFAPYAQTSVAFDGNGNIALAYSRNGYIKYATYESQSKSWNVQSVEASNLHSPGDKGVALAFDTANLPNIFYSYGGNEPADCGLKRAFFSGGVWSEEFVYSPDNGGSRTPSVVIDSSNNLHVAFVSNGGSIFYKKKTSGWTTTQIDICNPDRWMEPLYTSIKLDSDQKVHILYGQSTSEVHYATNATGTWNVTTIDATQAGTLSAVSLLIDNSDRVHIFFGNSSLEGSVRYGRK